MGPPHIGVMYIEQLPAETFESFAATIRHDLLDYRSEPREHGPFAGIEWLLPTAVVIYIGKSYFDAFLKEAGKDHYHLLKKATKALATKFVGPEAPTARLIFTKGKGRSELPQYSILYSIVAELTPELRVKLFLEAGLTVEACDNAVERFLEFLDAVHSQSLDLDSVKGLRDARPFGGTLLLAYSQDWESLYVVDPIPKTMRAPK